MNSAHTGKSSIECRDLSYEGISIGDSASFERAFTEDDVQSFSELSGDSNPLHMDQGYAETTRFEKRLVHGMLVGSLCSRLVGMHLPGKRCLYLQQNLNFKKPVYIGDTVTVKGTVASKSDSARMLELDISISARGEIAVEGTAIVQMI